MMERGEEQRKRGPFCDLCVRECNERRAEGIHLWPLSPGSDVIVGAQAEDSCCWWLMVSCRDTIGDMDSLSMSPNG